MKKTTCRILAALIIGYLPAHLSAVGCAEETSEILSDNSVIMTGDYISDKKADNTENRKITLDDILRLSHKGSELDWSDFEEYEYTDVGSGLYVYEYRLEESEYKDYVLSVSGLPEQKPEVLLIPAEYGSSRYCDISSSSEEEILAFLNDGNSDQNYISGFDALSLHKVCNYSLNSISVESLPGGYSYSFNNDKMCKVWDYLSGLKLISDFPENPNEYGGMTWVITLTCAAGHTEKIYHFGNMFIRDENGSWYKMDYNQASEFQSLINNLLDEPGDSDNSQVYTPDADSNIQGDLNSDGEINAADALIFKKWLMGTSDIKNSEIPAADLNNDGKVNIADFCLLKSKILETSENESSGIVNPSETRKITLNDILRLSHKGSELDWSDFEEYEYTDVGSGLYVYEYRLEESEYKDYVLSVSGLPEQKPEVLLIPAEYGSGRYCDIISSSEEEILAFLKGNNSEQNYISGFDALSLHKHCNYSLKSISVESLPEGYSYSFNNDNIYKVWDYLSNLKLISDFPENPDEYDGMTWVITLTCSAGHTETIYHSGNMFIRDENGSWYKMDYDQASGFHALLEELECN